MRKRRQKGTSMSEEVSFQEAARDMCRDYLQTYLHLCFTHPKILEKGYEAFREHWGGFKTEEKVVEAIKGLEKKSYIRCWYDRDSEKQKKILVLKHLAIPVNNNFAFFHQTEKRAKKSLHRLVLDPFDDPRKSLAEKVKSVKKKTKNKDSSSENKNTIRGHKKNVNPEPLSSSSKARNLQEVLNSFSFKTEKKLSSDLIPINVKDFSGSLIKKIFMKLENVKIFELETDLQKKPVSSSLVLKNKQIDEKYKKHFRNENFLISYYSSVANKRSNVVANNHCVLDLDRMVDDRSRSRLYGDNDSINTSNMKRKTRSTSLRQQKNIDSRCRECGCRCDEIDLLRFSGLDEPQESGKVKPNVARKKAKKGRKVNLEKIKTQYVQEKKARVSQREKRKNLSEEDIWEHIKNKNLDIFSPQVDREKILSILVLPKKSITRKELIEELGSKFSSIYFAYRQKLSEAFGVLNTYSKDFGSNLDHAKKAAEACIRYGVTPQFVIRYFHGIRSRFSSNLPYIPLSILSNSSMIDSAASAFLGEAETVKFGNEYAELEKLHPHLRKKLEEAGFCTRDYSDAFLMSIQINAIDIAEGYPMFISSDTKEMVYWAAENIFGGKKP